MSTSTPISKKRKATEQAAASSSSVTVLDPPTTIGPAWVNFPANRPAKKTPFTIYKRENEANSQADFSKQPTLIAGETGDMEFFSINKDFDMPEENYNCQYLPALYDPSTGSLTVQPVAPTYILAQRVKRLKTLGSTVNLSNPSDQRMLKRDQLGETFGTRKAKSRIKAAERNKVDAEAQAGVKDHLLSSIKLAGANIPSAEALELLATSSRQIPPPNLETTDPEEVYTLDALIPAEEFASIDPNPIIKVTDDRERMQLLPFRSSRWIEKKMRLAINLPFGTKKTTVKILYYIACLRQFQKMKKALGKTEELVEKMNGMPKVIIDGLIKRFTETAKGSTTPNVTATMENKLLAYQFALRLRCENYACDVKPIAEDLQMPDAKVKEIFRSLGCTVDRPTPADRERLGMSVEEAKSQKAILQAPPVFPKPKRGGPAKR